ncbi:MAG TPA: DUF6691 family protein [Fibrobacteria bacterium]|nr:DUF6691 family protein [Fibrobacteria bacterium]
MFKTIRILLLGALFGIVLTKAGVISWFKIRDMFFFREPDLYLIIGSAVATAMLSVLLIRRLHLRTWEGSPLPEIPVKKADKGKFLGGFIFGVGWFVAGTCPGPIYAQLGTGTWIALFTLAGAVAGAAAFDSVASKLPR